MKKTILVLLPIVILCGCATDRQTRDTLKAMRQDYLSGKMSEETYLKRVAAVKHAPRHKADLSGDAQALEAQRQREHFYRAYQASYTHPQEPVGQGSHCSENLDGGVTCEKHIYSK